MRLLMSSDIHGIWPVITWVLDLAHERAVDGIVLAGDLLGCPDGFSTPEEAQRADADRLNEQLERVGLPVFYVMGNDDLIELDAKSDQVQSVHGRSVAWGVFTVVGYQYALPFMGGTFEKPEEGIEADLSSLSDRFDARTICVSHSPAFGILDPGIAGSHIGSRSLRRLLDARPWLVHVHGHSHAGFGRSGNHFNVASAGQKRAILLDLETLQHEVLDGREGVRQT
jgi:Icc-related predicted phosphoesterase